MLPQCCHERSYGHLVWLCFHSPWVLSDSLWVLLTWFYLRKHRTVSESEHGSLLLSYGQLPQIECKSEKCEFSNCILSGLVRLFRLNLKITFEISGKKKPTDFFLTDCPINHPGEDQPYPSKKVESDREPFIYLGHLNSFNIHSFPSTKFALHLLKL